MRIGLMIILFFGVGLAPAHAQNASITSFAEAKENLWRVFAAHPKTFYCGCDFDRSGPDWQSCQFRAKKDSKRASRIEWEHVVPASLFGVRFPAWARGDKQCVSHAGKAFKGRKCAEKTSRTYRLMQADMYNLQPAIGEVNGLRSNYPFGEIAGERRDFGACDMEIQNKLAEPPASIRGDIARTYLYMHAVYPDFDIINETNRAEMERWDQADPVDAWECARNERIRNIQKSRNPILDEACARRQPTAKASDVQAAEKQPIAKSDLKAPSEPSAPAQRREKHYDVQSGSWGDNNIKDNF